MDITDTGDNDGRAACRTDSILSLAPLQHLHSCKPAHECIALSSTYMVLYNIDIKHTVGFNIVPSNRVYNMMYGRMYGVHTT